MNSLGGRSEWDNRQLFNMRFHYLLSTADVASINDDYDNWFDALRGIKRMIHDFLTDEEKADVEKSLNEARKWAKVGRRTSVNPETVQDKLDATHTLLYDLSHKYKLQVPRSDASGSGMLDGL